MDILDLLGVKPAPTREPAPPKTRPTSPPDDDDDDNQKRPTPTPPKPAKPTNTPAPTPTPTSDVVQSTIQSTDEPTSSPSPTSTPSLVSTTLLTTASTPSKSSSFTASISSSATGASAVLATPTSTSDSQAAPGLSDGAKAGIGVSIALVVIIALVAAAMKTFYFDRDRNGKPSFWERWRNPPQRAMTPPPLQPWEKSIAARPSYDPDQTTGTSYFARKPVGSTRNMESTPRSVFAQEQRSLSSNSTTQLLRPEKELPDTPQPAYQAYKPKPRSELFLD